MMSRFNLLFLFLILIAAFVLRLYRIDNPIGDWHAFRQADTSAVSKVYLENGIDLLHPMYFDISNIQSGKNNPQGYRMVEFPIYNVLQVVTFIALPVFSFEMWGRLVTVFSSTLTLIFIYLLTKKYIDNKTALFAAFFYAVLPFSIYYGRVILPDPTATMAIVGGTWFFSSWATKKSLPNFILACIFTAAAFLLKPFTIFFTLPLFYIAWESFGISFIKKISLWIFLIVSLIPLILWRIWISQFPEGIPVSNWLFNGGNIRFTGAYFYWIFGERLGKLILGYTGYALLFLGFLKNREKHFGFFLSLALSSLIYLVVVARGNVQHDYYQIMILPTICIFLGRGVTFLLSLVSKTLSQITYNFIAILGILVFCILGMLFFSWYYVRDYFNINNMALVTAGKIADQKLPRDAKVIAANEGDTSFLYYVGRKGWPSFQDSPENLKKLGATHIVIPNPTEQDFNGLGKEYPHLFESSDVLILEIK